MDQKKKYLHKKIIWLYAARGCIFFAGAVFFLGQQAIKHTGNGHHIMIALDISKSMLVNDAGPKANRLESAKELLYSLMQQNPATKRSVSIFASEHMILSPFIDDTTYLTSLIQSVDHRNLPNQGTNMSNVLSHATNIFSGRQEGVTISDQGNILLLISDGGEESVSVDDSVQQSFDTHGIKLITIGIGSQQGGQILEGKDIEGNPVFTTYQGAPVISALGESYLTDITQHVGGTYIRYTTQKETLRTIQASIQNIPTKTDNRAGQHLGWISRGINILLCIGLLFFLQGIGCTSIIKPVLSSIKKQSNTKTS